MHRLDKCGRISLGSELHDQVYEAADLDSGETNETPLLSAGVSTFLGKAETTVASRGESIVDTDLASSEATTIERTSASTEDDLIGGVFAKNRRIVATTEAIHPTDTSIPFEMPLPIETPIEDEI